MTRQDLRRRLAAIVFTDIVGFSKIMAHDESQALEILEIQRRLLSPIVQEYDGAILKEMGDGLLIEFASSVSAVQAAVAIQEALRENAESGSRAFQLRIGIHMGDVVASGGDILGDGVNIASRVEPLADPGGICITRSVYDSIKSIVEIRATRTDDVELKNISEKYTIYKIQLVHPVETTPSVDDSAPRFARVEVENVTDETDLKTSIMRLWPFYIIVILINLPVLREGGLFGVLFLAVMLLCGALLLYQRTVRVSFVDIRNVSVLLDVLIVRMNYGLIEQDSRCLTYLHAPAKWKMQGAMSWVKTHDSLTVVFDGNTVRMEGPNFHIRKVLGEIKRFGRIDPGAA